MRDVCEVERARATVVSVLDSADVVVRDLATYYDPAGCFTGATFDAPDPAPLEITAYDLVAVSSMGVELPPRAVRHLLDPGEHRTTVLAAIGEVEDVPLWDADDAVLDRAATLHRAAKRAISDGNAWVTASKLTARKRPSLTPVRDSVIGGLSVWPTGTS